MKSPIGYVYLITNKFNGKTYVGQRQLSLDRSWRQYLGSGKLVLLAIDKYGEENFIKSLLGYADTQNDLNSLEEKWIKKNWNNPAGRYNMVKRVTGVEGPKTRKNRNQKERDYLIREHSTQIIQLYKKYKNLRTVSDKLDLPISLVREALVRNNIELNHQNKRGRTHSESRIKSISEAMRKHVNENQKDVECEECKKVFEVYLTNRRTVLCPTCSENRRRKKIKIIKTCEYCGKEYTGRNEKFCSEHCSKESTSVKVETVKATELYEDGYSLREIGRSLNISHQSVYNLLRREKVPLRSKKEASKMSSSANGSSE